MTAKDLATLDIGRDMSNVFRRVPGVVANNIERGDTGNGFRMRGFAYGTAGALVVTTVPQASGGASLRYFF